MVKLNINGTIVDFERMPTDADIDEVAKTLPNNKNKAKSYGVSGSWDSPDNLIDEFAPGVNRLSKFPGQGATKFIAGTANLFDQLVGNVSSRLASNLPDINKKLGVPTQTSQTNEGPPITLDTSNFIEPKTFIEKATEFAGGMATGAPELNLLNQGINAGLPIAGKAIQSIYNSIKNVLYTVAKPAIKSKVAVATIKGTKNYYDKIAQGIDDSIQGLRQKIADVQFGSKEASTRQTMNQFLTKKQLTGDLENVAKVANERINAITEPLANAASKARDALSARYTQAAEKYGANEVNSLPLIEELDKLGIGGSDLHAILGTGYDSAAGVTATELAGQGLIKTNLKTENLINAKKYLSDELGKIFTPGMGKSYAKNTIGQSYGKVHDILDELIDHGTGDTGLYIDLGSRYKDVSNIFSFFKRDIKDQGLLLSATKRKLTSLFESKGGHSIGKLSPEEISGYIANPETVFQVADDRAYKLLSPVFALRQTGMPALIKEADMLEVKLTGILQQSASKKSLQGTLKSLNQTGIIDTTYRDLYKLNNEIRLLTREKEVGTREFESIFKRVSRKVSPGDWPTLLPIYMGGQASSAILESLGVKGAGRAIRGLSAIFMISKWAPSASKIILEGLKSLEHYTTNSVNKIDPAAIRIINNFIIRMQLELNQPTDTSQ